MAATSMIQIFHNARCSKSRAALLLAEQAADRLDETLCIRDYLSEPLSLSELTLLQRPVVVRNGRAVIGRPPEAVSVLFD